LALPAIQPYLNLIPAVRQSPQQYLWLSYDQEADVVYINFKKPSHATDSELTEDGVIVRYEADEVVGFTVLNASTRIASAGLRLTPACRGSRMLAACPGRSEQATLWLRREVSHGSYLLVVSSSWRCGDIALPSGTVRCGAGRQPRGERLL